LVEPLWKEIGNRLRVTMTTEQVGETAINSTDMTTLGMVNTHNGCGTSEITSAIRLSPRATRNSTATIRMRTRLILIDALHATASQGWLAGEW
jgi:hypothetical protein